MYYLTQRSEGGICIIHVHDDYTDELYRQHIVTVPSIVLQALYNIKLYLHVQC